MFPLPLFIGSMWCYNTRIKPFCGEFKFELNPVGRQNGILIKKKNKQKNIKFSNNQPRQLWWAIQRLHWTLALLSEHI